MARCKLKSFNGQSRSCVFDVTNSHKQVWLGFPSHPWVSQQLPPTRGETKTTTFHFILAPTNPREYFEEENTGQRRRQNVPLCSSGWAHFREDVKKLEEIKTGLGKTNIIISHFFLPHQSVEAWLKMSYRFHHRIRSFANDQLFFVLAHFLAC